MHFGITTSGILDWRGASAFWRRYKPKSAHHQKCPADQYGTDIATFINTVNQFNKIEIPLQNDAGYMKAVVELSRQHATLDSLCEALKARQLQMAHRIHDNTQHNSRSLSTEDSLFPPQEDKSRRIHIRVNLSYLFTDPSAETLGNFLSSYKTAIDSEADRMYSVCKAPADMPSILPAPEPPRAASPSRPSSPSFGFHPTSPSPSSPSYTFYPTSPSPPPSPSPPSYEGHVTEVVDPELPWHGTSFPENEATGEAEVQPRETSTEHPHANTQEAHEEPRQAKRKREDSTSSESITMPLAEASNEAVHVSGVKEQEPWMAASIPKEADHPSGVRNDKRERDSCRSEDSADEGDGEACKRRRLDHHRHESIHRTTRSHSYTEGDCTPRKFVRASSSPPLSSPPSLSSGPSIGEQSLSSPTESEKGRNNRGVNVTPYGIETGKGESQGLCLKLEPE